MPRNRVEQVGRARRRCGRKLEEQPLVVGRHLDVHGRAVGRHDRLRRPGMPSATQRVRMSLLFEPITSWSTGSAHPLGDPPGEDVAEVPGRHRERASAQPGDGGDVVDDLGHHPGPVDRVHGREAHPLPERGVGEQGLHEVLAVVERALDGHVVHVRRVDRRHLAPLDVARPDRRGGARRCRAGPARRRPRWRPSRCHRTSPPRWWPARPRAVSSWSNSRPTSCRATSLKASVGPQKSSRRCRSPSSTTGHTSGCSKVA